MKQRSQDCGECDTVYRGSRMQPARIKEYKYAVKAGDMRIAGQLQMLGEHIMQQ